MPKSKKCVFLGYATQQKGYKCLDIETKEIRISRDMLFDEDKFPFLDHMLRNDSTTKRKASMFEFLIISYYCIGVIYWNYSKTHIVWK